MNEYEELIKESEAAIGKGFFTSNIPNRQYGAAVLTKTGNVYSAGQYSSFNHITSIHAEMGAILIATMNEDEDIEALALSSNNNEKVCSCGVCLQFMKEHAARTGIDIKLIFNEKAGVREVCLSEITKDMW